MNGRAGAAGAWARECVTESWAWLETVWRARKGDGLVGASCPPHPHVRTLRVSFSRVWSSVVDCVLVYSRTTYES